MIRRRTTGAALVAIAALTAAGPARADVTQLARVVGRAAPDGAGLRFAWSGTALHARFEGTRLVAKLRDDGKHGLNAFQIVVDGQPHGVLQTSKAKDTYVVVENLASGPHEVSLHKRTEANVGEIVFYGFETDGKLLPPPEAKARRIELIGDSITTGYGNEGTRPQCGFDPRQENEFLAYGALASRALSADHTTLAWSGKTLHWMREYFARTLPAREESRWDFKRYQPQLVVLNVGTNNFANVDPGEARFVKLYLELYDEVRKAYPDAYIACALGPMLTDTYPEGRQNLTKARRYMRTVMTRLRAKGETKTDLLEFPEQKHTDGLGCGFHPGLKTHKLMADRLVAFAKERLGW